MSRKGLRPSAARSASTRLNIPTSSLPHAQVAARIVILCILICILKTQTHGAAVRPHSHYDCLKLTHPRNITATARRLCSSEHLMKLSFLQTQPPTRPVSLALVPTTPGSADSRPRSPEEPARMQLTIGMTSSSNLRLIPPPTQPLLQPRPPPGPA